MCKRNPFFTSWYTLQGTNISPKNGILKMIFLFPRWDMLIPWRVLYIYISLHFWLPGRSAIASIFLIDVPFLTIRVGKPSCRVALGPFKRGHAINRKYKLFPSFRCFNDPNKKKQQQNLFEVWLWALWGTQDFLKRRLSGNPPGFHQSCFQPVSTHLKAPTYILSWTWNQEWTLHCDLSHVLDLYDNLWIY